MNATQRISQQRMLRLHEPGVFLPYGLRILVGKRYELAVMQHIHQPKVGQTALPATQHIALVPKLQIVFRQFIAIIGAHERVEPRPRRLTGWFGHEEHIPRRFSLPTRPRSWWSCERPKQSAFSTIITVASGTSTPTSTTVVETRTSILPALKSAMTASF